MNGTLLLLAAAGAAGVALTVATREPTEPVSVAMVILGTALASGAFAARALLWLGPRRARRVRRAVVPALRRGAEIGAALGLLAFLRAIDGLTLLTGGFVLLAFALAEVALSTRPS